MYQCISAVEHKKKIYIIIQMTWLIIDQLVFFQFFLQCWKRLYQNNFCITENNNLLHPLQFGFRHNYSTETATCLLLENIKRSLDKGLKVGAVFLDLKKAFDSVNHNILMSKITKYNISKRSLLWFDSYLKSREQSVVINNVKSVPHNIDIGIPQGTILGPILFSIYINDLPEICPDASLQMYADDTVIYVSGRNCVEIEEKLSRNLEKVSAWLDDFSFNSKY